MENFLQRKAVDNLDWTKRRIERRKLLRPINLQQSPYFARFVKSSIISFVVSAENKRAFASRGLRKLDLDEVEPRPSPTRSNPTRKWRVVVVENCSNDFLEICAETDTTHNARRRTTCRLSRRRNINSGARRSSEMSESRINGTIRYAYTFVRRITVARSERTFERIN